jgi:hypothetical protein
MLYPIATVSYPLAMNLGLPYDAPFLGAMQYYKYANQYIQISIQIPYTVPDGYIIRVQFTSASIYSGTAYANFESLIYTPLYDYSVSNAVLLISGMGPIVVGTNIILTLQIYISTHSIFNVRTYIDTPAAMATFTTSKTYVFQGLAEGSGVAESSFFWSFYDNQFHWGWRTRSSTSIISSQWFYVQIYQNIDPSATSSGSYITFFLPHFVQVASNFDPINDCRFDNVANTCVITLNRTSTYLQVTVQGSASYLATNPNPFPFQTSVFVYIRNMNWPFASTNKYNYQVYIALYASNVVNPITYYAV